MTVLRLHVDPARRRSHAAMWERNCSQLTQAAMPATRRNVPRTLPPTKEHLMGTAVEEPITIGDYDREEVDRANASGRTPVVFVHGLWLLPSSWDRWTTVFEEAGYTTVMAGWPDDPATVEE